MPILACIIAIVISAGTLALSLHLVTAPDHEPQRATAASNVRQIPLGKTSDVAKGDPQNQKGDPQNQLTPVYPASPGKDLPPPAAMAGNNTNVDAVDAPANAPVSGSAPAAAETTGVAAVSDDTARETAAAPPAAASPAITPVAATTAAAPNRCAIAACSAAYRSFRGSDCTYQPFEGARKVCDVGEDGIAQNASPVSAPPQLRERNIASPNRVRGRGDELADVERVVRSLPRREYDDGYDDARIVIIERPGMGYGRPGVIYRED